MDDQDWKRRTVTVREGHERNIGPKTNMVSNGGPKRVMRTVRHLKIIIKNLKKFFAYA